MGSDFISYSSLLIVLLWNITIKQKSEVDVGVDKIANCKRFTSSVNRFTKQAKMPKGTRSIRRVHALNIYCGFKSEW